MFLHPPEALAAQLLAKAMDASGTGLLELRKIEAARDIAETLSKSRNVIYLPSSGANGGGSNILLVCYFASHLL